MISKEDTIKILTYAAMAPSGSNSQPWKFRVLENCIEVVALPHKDHPILNVHNRGTWVGHGALLENLSIASLALGWKAEIRVFPDAQIPDITARITLTQHEPISNKFFEAISKRSTNRKSFQRSTLLSEDKKIFDAYLQEPVGAAKLFFVEDVEKIKELGKAIATNEIVMLENKTLHRLFFDEIVWNKREEQQKQAGLYVKTMELASPQEKAFRAFRHWPVMKFANMFGFAEKVIAAENAKNYASCALMGLIAVPDEDYAFIDAGRLMERVWLCATAHNLGFHLMTGVLFLKQSIDYGNLAQLSHNHQILINNSYEVIKNIFFASDRTVSGLIPIMLFRIGKSEPPSAYSSKKLPDIEFI